MRKNNKDFPQPQDEKIFSGTSPSIQTGLLLKTRAFVTAESFRARLTSDGLFANGPREITTVILGAGIAGLVAAYELVQAGYRCIVLEARDRPGGRTETIRQGDIVEEVDSRQVCSFDEGKDFYFDVGPARIPQHHSRIVSYCREFGIPLQIFMNDNRGAFMYSSKFNGRVRLRGIHTALRGRFAELLVKAATSNALDEVVSGEEKALLISALVQYGDLTRDLRFAGSTRGGIMPSTGEEGPPITAHIPEFDKILRLSPFAQFLFHGPEYYDHQGTMLHPRGGMDSIPRAFADRLQECIRYEHIVTAIRRTEAGVRIEFTHRGTPGTVAADRAILAIPASVLHGIPNDFSPETNAALKSIEYTPAAKLAFQAERFWETDEQVFGGFSLTDEAIMQIWYPNEGFGTKEGILLGAYVYGGEPGEMFAQLSPEERISIALSQGDKIHPGYKNYVKAGISRSWLKTPYSLGGWSLSPPPPQLQQPEGPFIFAGEHTTYLNSTQEGATISGHRAVELLLGGSRLPVHDAVVSSVASNMAIGTPDKVARAVIR